METTDPGGINKVVREIAKNLTKNGHDVSVLQSNPSNLPNEEIYDDYKLIRVSSCFEKHFYGLNLSISPYLKKFLKKFNPDIVHIHGYSTLFSTETLYIIKKINKEIPIIFSPHFGVYSHETFAGKHFWGTYNQYIGRKFIKIPDVIISASNFEANNIKNILAPENKIIVIPHGVNDINLTKNNEDKEIINLLYVGYLLKLKGIQYILETINELIYKKNVNVNFKIVGEGPYEHKLKKITEELNLNEFVSWEGFVHNSQLEKLQEYYKKSDVFLLLSQSENYGIVVPEALTMGTPVIVTKRTALNEFLKEPGCFGVGYPPDPKEVANLIIKIKKDNFKVGPFSKKIRTWNEVSEDYERVYSNLLNGS
jgi:glycosyltransferase involved in cell wall biosynthesis